MLVNGFTDLYQYGFHTTPPDELSITW